MRKGVVGLRDKCRERDEAVGYRGREEGVRSDVMNKARGAERVKAEAQGSDEGNVYVKAEVQGGDGWYEG